jgi:hypothetical protein
VHKLLNAVEAQLDDFDMQQLNMVWWALGKLGLRPSRDVVNRFFGRTASMLVDLEPQARLAGWPASCAAGSVS